jgi:hypothetical protein
MRPRPPMNTEVHPSVVSAVRELETWPDWVLERSGMDRLISFAREQIAAQPPRSIEGAAPGVSLDQGPRRGDPRAGPPSAQ